MRFLVFPIQFFLSFLFGFRDPYHKIARLDPEKLKIFQTVQEITGMHLMIKGLICYLVDSSKNKGSLRFKPILDYFVLGICLSAIRLIPIFGVSPHPAYTGTGLKDVENVIEVP